MERMSDDEQNAQMWAHQLEIEQQNFEEETSNGKHSINHGRKRNRKEHQHSNTEPERDVCDQCTEQAAPF